MIKTIRQAADAFVRKFTPRGFTKEEPGATLARALIHPKTNETVARVNDSGELTGTAVTALLAAVAVAPGAVIAFAGAAAPTGWLLCYGQAVSRETYADLFAAISTAHGVGDGSTTFNLPDLRGRVVAGKDDMGGASANRLTDQDGGVNGDVLGDVGGSETHVLTEAQLAAHTHQFTQTLPEGTAIVSAGGTGQLSDSTANGSSDATSSTGNGAAHNNVQPTIILNYIIKF